MYVCVKLMAGLYLRLMYIVLCSVAVEKALTILASTLNLCGNCKQLRAKVHVTMQAVGHGMRMLRTYNNNVLAS